MFNLATVIMAVSFWDFIQNPFGSALDPWTNMLGHSMTYLLLGLALSVVIYSNATEQQKIPALTGFLLLYLGIMGAVLGTNTNLILGIILLLCLTVIFIKGFSGKR